MRYLFLVLFLQSSVLYPRDLSELGPIHEGLNFGVVVRNEKKTIYRSRKLGSGGLKELKKFLDSKNLPFPKTIIYMNKTGYLFPFYHAISTWRESDKYGFRFIHPFGENLRSYVNGYNPYESDEDIDKFWLGPIGRLFFKTSDNGIDGTDSDFLTILERVLSSNEPILFQCHGGMHRTGMMGMAVRYVQGGWWTDGDKVEDKGMLMNPAQYEYTTFNTWLFRRENMEFIQKLSNDDRFLRLVSRYRVDLQEE